MTNTEKRLEEVLKIAVDRFLGWKLPADFSPDGGISFKSGVYETTGTNLFTAQQANEMLKYVLEEALATSITQALAEDRERVVREIEKELKLLSSAYAGLETLPEKSANLAIRDSFVKILDSLDKLTNNKE